LLEHHLIKQYRPKYNILLKIDDKSYPFLLLSVHEDFPTLSVHRGKKKKPGLYFGPYANAYAMNQAMISIQKLFRLRTCSDAMFLGRSRPCMLAQIDRCTAPCVGRVTKEDYQQQVKLAKVFLKGDTGALFEHCMHEMNEAADAKCYEKAAEYRDIIRSLQSISAPSHGPLVDGMTCDVLAIAPYAAGWVVTMSLPSRH
jgi:excinuclease ABC subunit C